MVLFGLFWEYMVAIFVTLHHHHELVRPRLGVDFPQMSRSTPSIPSTPSSSTLAPSLGTTLPPFSTTSTARLQALYSDFSRQKQSNPTSYHANVEWWCKAFESLVSSGKQDFLNPLQFEDVDNYDPMTKSGSCDRLVLHVGRGLMERLKIPRVGKPLALGNVVVRYLFHYGST